MTRANPAAGKRADSTRRRQRAEAALAQAAAAGEDITVSSVARRPGVDRTFFYRHRDLLERIHVQQAQPPAAAAGGPAASRASLQADLANANARCARLAAHVRQLEKRLSQALGAQAWHESGLGAPGGHRQAQRPHHRTGTAEHQPASGTRGEGRRTTGSSRCQPRANPAAQCQRAVTTSALAGAAGAMSGAGSLGAGVAEAEQVHRFQAEHDAVVGVDELGVGEDEAAVGLGP